MCRARSTGIGVKIKSTYWIPAVYQIVNYVAHVEVAPLDSSSSLATIGYGIICDMFLYFNMKKKQVPLTDLSTI